MLADGAEGVAVLCGYHSIHPARSLRSWPMRMRGIARASVRLHGFGEVWSWLRGRSCRPMTAVGQNRAFEVIPGNYHVMQCADVRVVRCNRQLLTRNA